MVASVMSSSLMSSSQAVPVTSGNRDAAAASATRALFKGVGPNDPGCSVAVARAGRIVFAEAYGSADLSRRVPMTTKSVVDIGSVSKQFTATAVAILLNRGQLRLGDVVDTYVGGLPAWSRRVTVDQLIHHTSGIADYIDLLSDNGIDDTARSTDADALAALRAAPTLAFKPGRRFEYSNSNYFLLGQIVKRVTGDGIGTFVGREIFRPLTLDARMDAASRLPGKARSYARDGGTWVSADSAWLQLGDGGIQTTPTQLVRWASQYWSPTVGGPSINTVRWIGAVQTDEPGVRYGFGMQETSDPDLGRVLFHDGSWGGFSTSFEVLPSRQLAVAGTCTSGDLDIEQTDWASEVVAAWARS